MPIEKRWVVKPQGDPATVAMLAAALRISPVLANLLVQRGIDNVEKAEKFFKPSLADLHDPFLMKDMDRAVERVERAVANNEKIMVTATTTWTAARPSRWFTSSCARSGTKT